MEKLDIDIKGVLTPLIYEYSSSLPIVNLKLVFKVAGSIYAMKPGLAKISAALLNEGTKQLGVNEFSKRLEMLAIDINASAGFESFSIEINCLKEHFKFAFDMLIGLLSDPNYSEDTLNKLKINALGIIAANASDFDYQAKVKLNEILFDGTNLSLPSIGTKSSIESIEIDDIRNFLIHNLDISNLFLVLGGDIKVCDVDFQALKNVLKKGKLREIKKIQTSDKCKKEFVIKQSEQAYVYFGSPFNVEDDEKYLASVATFILGSSGFGSRLMEEIRVKRGLAYSVYARNDLNLSYKAISGYLQTKNESKDEAISVVQSEFENFLRDGVSQKELDQAKNFLLGSEPLSKETLFKRLSIAQNEYYFGYELGEFDRNLNKIKDLKLDRLNEFIKSHDEILKQSFAVIYNEI